MKKMAGFFFVFSFIAVTSFAQLRTIPKDAETTLQEKYSGLEKVEWVDNLINFTAIFSYEGLLHKAKFSNKGKWLQTEKAWEAGKLPAEVLSGYEKSKFGDQEADEWAVVESPKENAALLYRATVSKSALEKKYLYFNEEGRLVKESITL